MEKKNRELLLNPVYADAYNTKERYRVLYGSAGSGKSHYVAQETILNMMEFDSFRYLAVRKTDRSIRHSVFKLLTDIIEEYELKPFFVINKTEMSITCLNGSSLITSGLDDTEKLKSIANINRIWIEEASEITEEDFNQLDLRLRGQSDIGYQLTLTFNPISELHWLKKSFFDIGRPNTYILKTTYKDNMFLDKQYIKTLHELEKQDYNYYKVYALGEWGSVGSVIFSNWKKEDLSDIKHTFDNIYHGLDFGFADDPTAYVKAHYDKKRKRIYIVDEFYKEGQFIDEIADELYTKLNGDRIVCDSSEPRSIADLRRHNIKAVGAKKGAGSIEHGIKFIQSNELVIDSSCTNMINEVSGYKWREDRNGNALPKPVDKDNHLIDALRYSLESEMVQDDVRLRTFRGGI